MKNCPECKVLINHTRCVYCGWEQKEHKEKPVQKLHSLCRVGGCDKAWVVNNMCREHYRETIEVFYSKDHVGVT